MPLVRHIPRILAACLCLALLPTLALAQFPKHHGYVNGFSHVLSDS